MTRPDLQTPYLEALRDILRAAGLDMTDDALIAGVRSLATDRKTLMEANGELASEVRRLTPAEVEARVLREEVVHLRKLCDRLTSVLESIPGPSIIETDALHDIALAKQRIAQRRGVSDPPRVDVRRFLQIVAAYIAPSSPITYGRFVELLAAIPGLEGTRHADVYPALFETKACTHPNGSNDFAGYNDCEKEAKALCAELGIDYVLVCTCENPDEPGEHSPFCPAKERP